MQLRKTTSVLGSVFRNVIGIQRLRCRPLSSSSALPPNTDTVKVEVSPDGDYIVCWHPEPTVPYEFTKPLPRKEEDCKASDSVLKVQYLQEQWMKFGKDGPTNPELVKMFSTPKYHFRPRPKRRYAKTNPPVDRKAI